MIQFVSDYIEQANELMLFNCAEILLKLELYLKNIFQILSNTSFKYKYKYTNLVFFKYKCKYKYLRIWIQIQIRMRIWTQPWPVYTTYHRVIIYVCIPVKAWVRIYASVNCFILGSGDG